MTHPGQNHPRPICVTSEEALNAVEIAVGGRGPDHYEALQAAWAEHHPVRGVLEDLADEIAERYLSPDVLPGDLKCLSQATKTNGVVGGIILRAIRARKRMAGDHVDR